MAIPEAIRTTIPLTNSKISSSQNESVRENSSQNESTLTLEK